MPIRCGPHLLRWANRAPRLLRAQLCPRATLVERRTVRRPWSMARSLTPDLPRRAIAVVACVQRLFLYSGVMQLVTLMGGAIAGSILCRSARHTEPKLPAGLHPRAAWIASSLFLSLLVGLSSAALFRAHGAMALANIFLSFGCICVRRRPRRSATPTTSAGTHRLGFG